MADKYIIHGAAFYGDGTSSAEATSDGGVGAWNNIDIFSGATPTYGSLNAGDVVYIRSKTSGGADITVTLSAAITLGSASATLTNRITWIIDGGTVWSGINGVLTYLNPADAQRTVNLRIHNDYIAEKQDALAVVFSLTGGNQLTMFNAAAGGSYVKNIMIDWGVAVLSNGCRATFGASTFENLHVKAGRIAVAIFAMDNSGFQATFINPNVELFATPGAGAIFYTASYTSHLVVGGRISGIGATSGQTIVAGGDNGTVELIGVAYPNTMTLSSPRAGSIGRTTAYGADGKSSSAQITRGGLLDSRTDDNYPTLSAVLPDSASTPWSWKLYPEGATKPAPLPVSISKIYTDTAAAKTITVELLVANAFAGIDTQSVWLSGSYINTSGQTVVFDTRANAPGTALATSTAAWSATTYGAISLLKRKISITTPSAIKQDTQVTLRLSVAAKSASANDLLFTCPDVQLT